MIVTPITDPIAGEHIVEVNPTMSPKVESAGRRRMHFYPGRTLSDTALRLEQEHRSSRLAALGRRVAPGVVNGLEVVFDDSGEPARKWDVHVGSGRGIAASGEDVVVPKAMQFNLLNLQVYGPQILIAMPPRAVAGPPPKNAWAKGTQYILGGSFGDLMRKKVPMPSVGILVLQPITGHLIGEYEDFDPCDQSAQGYAFEDWRSTDGCRLILHLWPLDLIPLPPEGDPDSWRNRIAYTIFEYEGQGRSRRRMPWDRLGVPIGVFGISRGFAPSFMDQAAVVRAGGKLERRSILVPKAGNSRLWRARIDQFNDQILPMILEELPAGQTAKHFRWLPPIGLLPKDAIDPRGGESRFFPSHFTVDAVPIPEDQLDVATNVSASLAPYDTDAADRVQVLVPVPPAYYEPGLLITERVAPEFYRVIHDSLRTCYLHVSRRKNVRDKRSLLEQGATGDPKDYPDPDRERVPGERPAGVVPEDYEEGFGTKLAPDGKTRQVEVLVKLRGSITANKVLSAAEISTLPSMGLRKFITFLEAKVKRADDTIDFGFVRVGANIYRIRQFMLGSEAASRLATSPSLAAIATGESAVTTREDISEFLKRMKDKKPIDPDPDRSLSPGTPSGPTPGGPTVFRSPVGLGGRSVPGVGDFITLIQPTRKQPPPETIREETRGKALKGQKKAHTKEEVEGQTEIVGKDYDPRTMTLAMRLNESPARESKAQGIAITYETIKNLAALDINFKDEIAVGLPVQKDGKPVYDKFGRPVRKDTKFSDLQADHNLVEGILKDPDPEDADEAAFFSDTVDVLDANIGALRRVEGIILGYKKTIAQCKAALEIVVNFAQKADDRLDVIGNVLIEVRHDILVVQSLLKDEKDRVDGINARRSQIIEQHVRYLAYHRPRSVDASTRYPVRSLDPDIGPELAPFCLECDLPIPTELRSMVNLFRDLPAKWFPRIRYLIKELSSFSAMSKILASMKIRAETRSRTLSYEEKPISKCDTGMEAFANVFNWQWKQAMQYTQQLAMIELPGLSTMDWLQGYDLVTKVATVGDLIDSDHGHSSVARRAVEELDSLQHAAAHLHTMFEKVDPALRLNWVLSLSQYDEPVNLRNLTSLKHWGEIDLIGRLAMQRQVDWLYKQVDNSHPEAVNLLHDLVRVCILLASHAPTHQITTGEVSTPTTVIPGGLVPLTVDSITRLAIGQTVLIYSADQVAAKGVVENIQVGKATARIITMETEILKLDKNTRVQIGAQLSNWNWPVSGIRVKKVKSKRKYKSSQRGRRCK